MASVFIRNNILYINWYDPYEGKSKYRSIKLKATVKNKKIAKELAKKLQKELDKQKEALTANSLTKRSSLRKAFEHFKKNNASKHPKTIKDYDRFFNKLIESFNESSSCSVLNKISAEDWILNIKKLPLSRNSIHGYYKQFNHFLNFLFEYSYIPMFKINRDVKTKPEVKEKIIFNDGDIATIFSNLEAKNQNFRTAVYLLFYTGLRSSDILTIEIKDIDLNNQTINYYSPKRKSYKQIPMHLDLVPIIQERMEKVSEGGLLDYSSVEILNRAVTRYKHTLEINGRGYTARTFRKTFITLCRSRYDMDATIVKELVGHEHGNTTDRYYNKISMNRMREELVKFRRPVVGD